RCNIKGTTTVLIKRIRDFMKLNWERFK
ncbi:hypothetical protein A2U01_0105081, partial [Trifolium medium]|nr:hypothetical protein [Trifolium medium]